MYADKVAPQGVAFDCTVLTQMTAVKLLTGLPEHVDPQLALAGEVVLADGALKARVRKMETHVLYQVRAGLKATSAFCTYVCAKHVLCALFHMIYNTNTHRF